MVLIIQFVTFLRSLTNITPQPRSDANFIPALCYIPVSGYFQSYSTNYLAGQNLKSWVHVPKKKKLLLSFTEIFQSLYKWSKNGQKTALCCNISKWDVFQKEISLFRYD